MRAILSVSDKTGLVDFARGLEELGFELCSTGGTKKALTEAGISVRSVSDLTGFPEILDGRVKTLHPAVHGGILARRNLTAHVAELEQNKMGFIDLVAVNLYPFRATVAKPEVGLDEALENIDIGGPTMIRAAAKNFPDVLVVVDPADYESLLEQLRRGEVRGEERKKLAQKAFQHVAAYDTAIAQYLRRGEEGFADEMTIALRKRYDLRYGENPHQEAVFYVEEVAGESVSGISSARQLWGKELSFNNILDSDAAWSAATDFEAPAVSVIKHTNPCGLASHQNLAEAYRRALSGDTVSAFGGIVALNRPVDFATAEEIAKTFYEVIIAPDYEEKALDLLKQKRDLRILAMGSQVSGSGKEALSALDFRRVSGGLLVQTSDSLPEGALSLRTVTEREPTEEELKDLLFAWKAVKHVKSNAIVLVKDSMILGMGAGQPNRVTSVRIALEKAGERSQGSVVGSDAFFPFPDGVELAAKGGATAIIQPGGSVRDEEVIATANKYKVAMVFTGVRHFRH
ncbi:MAG: bifunctional phosphoribosylaminoimidazolecarboxamide formyltransferase/IMP cyclohydrolase [Dehalococcoidia bacterium]|nr:MAG: bifunctional phosphoribosylaminoimidazolecarboxamide formyltransferase/IMP cyclohydrolase [Dehalococcoidia bacterium]